MRIGLGIITYNRLPCLKKCLKSIQETDASSLSKIVIADDCSTDGTQKWLLEQKNIVSVIGRQNAGVARNSNRALKLLQDVDYGFLINDDIWFRKSGWIKTYTTAMSRTSYEHFCFMGGAKGINLVKTEVLNGIEVSFHNRMMGSFLTFSKKILQTVGGFDARFGMYGIEHSEWSERIGMAGLTYPCDIAGTTALKIQAIDVGNSLEFIADIPYNSVFDEEQKLKHLQEALMAGDRIRKELWSQRSPKLFKPFITEENVH